jgi:hypothetical protein
MWVALRFVGLVNAAIWFGGCVFFTFAAAPAIFQPEMKRLLQDYNTGVVASLMQERYFAFQVVCGLIALAHALLEWLLRRPDPRRLPVGLLAVLCAISFAGAFWFQPRIKALHQVRYTAPTLLEREQARATFRRWHGLSQGLNLVLLGGLVFYLWRAATPVADPPFLRSGSR